MKKVDVDHRSTGVGTNRIQKKNKKRNKLSKRVNYDMTHETNRRKAREKKKKRKKNKSLVQLFIRNMVNNKEILPGAGKTVRKSKHNNDLRCDPEINSLAVEFHHHWAACSLEIHERIQLNAPINFQSTENSMRLKIIDQNTENYLNTASSISSCVSIFQLTRRMEYSNGNCQ